MRMEPSFQLPCPPPLAFPNILKGKSDEIISSISFIKLPSIFGTNLSQTRILKSTLSVQTPGAQSSLVGRMIIRLSHKIAVRTVQRALGQGSRGRILALA